MPLAGVVFWQWSVSSVVILYWFENIVLGVINVARMAITANAAGLFLIPFFVFHYFFLSAGHAIFVFGLFPDDNAYFAEAGGIGMLSTLARAIEIFSTPLALAAIVLTLSHAVSFGLNFLAGGEYRRLDLQKLMTMPYGRIVVLHLTIIFGGFVTLAMGEPVWVIVILVLVKTGVDLGMHVREHRRAADDADRLSEIKDMAAD